MSNSIRILFLADFHYTDNNILNRTKYIESFCESVNNWDDTLGIDILVIAGDVCDKGGSEADYEKVADLINYIMEKIDIKKVIVVPGNHDVNRNVLMGLRGDKDRDEDMMWKYVEKYKYFKNLSKINNVKIDLEKAIVSCELVCDNYLFMGIDSNCKIGITDGVGYVDVEKLENEFAELQNHYGEEYNDLMKIVVMHHYPHYYVSHLEKAANNNNLCAKTIGNFDLDNWEKLKKLFNKYGVRVVLTGHIHGSQISATSDCEEGETEIYYSAIGSLGMNFNSELADILKCIDESSMTSSQQEKYHEFLEWFESDSVILSVSNHHNTYGIITIDEEKIEEQHYKYLADEGVSKWVSWFRPPKQKRIMNTACTAGRNPFEKGDIKVKPKQEEIFEKNILDIIRQEHLYRTGHFHWKDQCVMNWIDTTALLINSKYLNMISNCIMSKFSEILDRAECVIGLGIKGAIIMSSIRYKYPNKRFSYYPEEDKNYNEFEKCILNNGNMDNIIVLTDVVHSGGTVKSFVENNKKQIAGNSVVEVITIFLTDETLEIESVIKGGDNQQMIEIKVNELMKIPVRNCGKNSSNCSIIKEKLDVVYEM